MDGNQDSGLSSIVTSGETLSIRDNSVVSASDDLQQSCSSNLTRGVVMSEVNNRSHDTTRDGKHQCDKGVSCCDSSLRSTDKSQGSGQSASCQTDTAKTNGVCDDSDAYQEMNKEFISFNKSCEGDATVHLLRDYTPFQVRGSPSLRLPQTSFTATIEAMSDMYLAHEVAINKDFALEFYSPPNTSIENMITVNLRRAFFDLLEESLAKEKPNFQQTLVVLQELKKMVLEILMPHNDATRNTILSFMEESNMKYEIEHDIFEVKKYTNFLIEILGKLCCPIRDKEVENVGNLKKPAETIKGIVSLIKNMKLDMANFLVNQIRPTIIQESVTYERLKFASFIEQQLNKGEDPLKVTRVWITRHKENNPQKVAIAKSFTDLLCVPKDTTLAETLFLDWSRYYDISEEVRRVTYLGAAIISAANVVRMVFTQAESSNGNDGSSPIPVLNGSSVVIHKLCEDIRKELATDMNVLIQKEDCSTKEKLENVMSLLGEQAIKVTDNHFNKKYSRGMSDTQKDMMRKTVEGCSLPDQPVRQIILNRIREYSEQIVAAGSPKNIPLPPGLVFIGVNVVQVVSEFSRISLHNLAVFHDIYEGILTGEIPPPEFDEGNICNNRNFSKVFLLLKPPEKSQSNPGQPRKSYNGDQ